MAHNQYRLMFCVQLWDNTSKCYICKRWKNHFLLVTNECYWINVLETITTRSMLKTYLRKCWPQSLDVDIIDLPSLNQSYIRGTGKKDNNNIAASQQGNGHSTLVNYTYKQFIIFDNICIKTIPNRTKIMK